MSDEEQRDKIIERGRKIRELANRGVGGEKENAIRMLEEFKERHGITDADLNAFQPVNNEWYDNAAPEVRTGKFGKWFKNSVAVYNGEPMTFFHKSRTLEPFFEFDSTKGVKYYPDTNNFGFHFVHEEDRKYVLHLGNTHLGYGVEFYVYLKMVNPYYIYSRLDGNNYGQNGEPHIPININKPLGDMLIAHGYDSIIIQDEYGINVYVVFSPNQIKSIDNSGEYSTSNNIYC